MRRLNLGIMAPVTDTRQGGQHGRRAVPPQIPGATPMTLTLGSLCPDFTADTTEGTIRFHEWLGQSWGVLFSHPKDFTPVCTTELGAVARLKPEFDRRNCKVIGLSGDPVEKHMAWSKELEETQGHAPNYPMIGDTDLAVSKAYGM